MDFIQNAKWRSGNFLSSHKIFGTRINFCDRRNFKLSKKYFEMSQNRRISVEISKFSEISRGLNFAFFRAKIGFSGFDSKFRIRPQKPHFELRSWFRLRNASRNTQLSKKCHFESPGNFWTLQNFDWNPPIFWHISRKNFDGPKFLRSQKFLSVPKVFGGDKTHQGFILHFESSP